jgi:2EXR family
MPIATSFTKFPLLPAELRLMIWECAIPEPRVIRYTSRTYREYISWYHTSIYRLEQTIPGIIHACYDSRREALKRYKIALLVELARPVYFDFERDTLEFGDFEALEAFSKLNTRFNGSTLEADRIRTVAITLEPRELQAARMQPDQFTLICSNFAKLEELKVRETNDYWRSEYYWWSGSTGSPGRWLRDIQPLRVIESEEIVGYGPHARLLAGIRRNIEWRGGDVKGWKPPRVIVGSGRQWEWALEKDGKSSHDIDEMDVDEKSRK